MKRIRRLLLNSNEEYLYLIDSAFDIFNQQMDTDYSRENIEVRLVTAETADTEIRDFLRDYPEACEPQMFEPGYCRSIRAEAFVTPDRSGIIVRTDLEEKGVLWRHILLHEICHVFCTTHELPEGEMFYDKYCEGYAKTTEEDGVINSGYAIWREFIAEFLADILDIDLQEFTLHQNKPYIDAALDEIAGGTLRNKECVLEVLCSVFCSRDILGLKSREKVFEEIGKIGRLSSPHWQALLNVVYEQLHNPGHEIYEIDLDFIKRLGAEYLFIWEDAMRAAMEAQV